MVALFAFFKRWPVAVWLLIASCLLAHSAVLSPVWYDEACHWLTACGVADFGVETFPVDPANGNYNPHSLFITTGATMNYPIGAVLALFGKNILFARLCVAFFSVGAVWLVYQIALKINPKRGSAWAVAVLLGSIQFITYGAQVLGEPLMIFWLLAALWRLFFLIENEKRRFLNATLIALFFNLSILSKEYIALPVGLTVFAVFIFSQFYRKYLAVYFLVIGLSLPVGVALYYALRFGNLTAFLDYYQLKSAYGKEFLAFEFGQTFRFLFLKPAIWLGYFALTVKVYFRPNLTDVFIWILFSLLIALFLVGAGYDRFGLVLIVLGCLYLGEFLSFLWFRLVADPFLSTKLLRSFLFLAVFGLFFIQKTPFLTIKRSLEMLETNDAEKIMVKEIAAKKIKTVYTPELALIPFLPTTVNYVLPLHPPCASQLEPISSAKFQIWGEYAETEYKITSDAGFRILFRYDGEKSLLLVERIDQNLN